MCRREPQLVRNLLVQQDGSIGRQPDDRRTPPEKQMRLSMIVTHPAWLLALAPTLSVSLGGAALAMQEEAEVEPGIASTKDDARSLKRLIHLSGGQVIRDKARLIGDNWEIERGRGRQTIPTGAVVRVELEKDVLREARKRAKELVNKDGSGRVALAGWMIDEGLLQESVDELNKVLTQEPDHTGALALLDERRIPMTMPRLNLPPDASEKDREKALDNLLRFGAKASPVGRELCIAELDSHVESGQLKAEMREQLFTSSPLRRSFATHALRRLYPGEFLKELLTRAILDPSDNVRVGASHALGASGEPVVIVPVLRALESSHPKIRTNAAQALGDMGFAAAVEPMMVALSTMSAPQGGGALPAPGSYIFSGQQFAYIQDFDVEVAQFQAVADPQVNVLTEGSVLDVRIQGLTSTAVGVQKAAMRRSLSKLTGASPGNSTRAWESWWEENRHRWVPEARKRDGSKTSSG
jgi:hypothetical protein